MKKISVIFDYKLCIACGICAQACPTSAINLDNTQVDKYCKAYPTADEKCTGCAICVNTCPIEAIKIEKE